MTEESRTEAQMRQSAELVVDTCFEVTDGDVVTIITDDRRKPEAEMVATVVAERGGLPIVANNEVLNPGPEDLVMMFSFPSPDYPPTERRETR